MTKKLIEICASCGIHGMLDVLKDQKSHIHLNTQAVPASTIMENIAKGTTDPRVEWYLDKS